jgi:cytochrome oxidase assembly protein ShyY1
MYRFLLSPKWLGFHLLVLCGVIVMVNLSFWQLDRLEARREFNAAVIDRADLPAQDLDTLLGVTASLQNTSTSDPIFSDLEWRQAHSAGVYLPDYQVTVINRSQNGRAGANLVTPLRLRDGRILIVNRGFVPLGVGLPDTPEGEVEVRGLLRVSQERRTGQLSDPTNGTLTELQRLDIDRLSAQLPGPVIPMYLQLLSSVPAETPGIPEPVIRPDLSEGSHLSYAVQWLIFAIAVVVGWVLAVRRSLQHKRRTVTVPEDVIEDAATADQQSSTSAESAVTQP